MDIPELIERIETCAAQRGLAPATVTSRGVGNSRLYARLKAGGGCNLKVATRLCAYMDAPTASPPSGKHGNAPASRQGEQA